MINVEDVLGCSDCEYSPDGASMCGTVARLSVRQMQLNGYEVGEDNRPYPEIIAASIGSQVVEAIVIAESALYKEQRRKPALAATPYSP